MRRLSIAIVFLGGCSESESVPEDGFRVTDQSGGVFLWTEDDRVHRLAGLSPELPDCREDERADYTYMWGRFVNVVGMCWDLDGSGGSTSGAFGRFLVCESDDDCPEIDRRGESYECRAGFCQNVDVDAWGSGVPGYSDLLRICTGDEPRPETIDYGADQTPLDLAIEAACPGQYGQTDEPCLSIPDECPDPR